MTKIDAAYIRYGQLIDQRFLTGISDEEIHELETLKNQIELAEAPYYARAFYRLTHALQRMSRNTDDK